MSVEIFEVLAFLAAMACGSAHSIFYRATTVVDGVDEMMSEKQSYASIDCGLVNALQSVFQTLQRERITAVEHGTKHKNAHRRGFYVTVLK